uniref:Leucine rich repeats and guanylate kinase domain containing n=1 Tax=Lynx canadensis TaxID=61383 RepID=A0A667GLD6_LYNCA
MATAGSDPQWPMPSSLQGSSRRGAQSILSRSEKERQSCWSSSPMGQRRKGTFHRASSYLLPQLVHRSVESDADGQDCGDVGEGEVESEESSESEMLNLEEEFDGVLREEVVANALHQLGRSGSGTEQVYLNLTLSGCGLIDISILCEYVHLQKLDLSLNKIEDLSCVSCMPYLLELNASHNKLTTFFNFKPPKNLKSNNQIEKMTGLEELKALQVVDLSHNQISSLQGLENHDFLEVINLEDNKIAELGEIDYIENLPLLRVVNFLRNPVQEKSEYWLFVIFMLLQLTELDQKKIKVEEKVAAVNRYNPPPEVVAAQDHLTHVLNSVMQPQRIFDSTLPRLDAPYPMLVLAGPEACGKRELAHRLCRQLSAYFRYGACHTTRPPYFGEGDRVDYHFISQEVFDEMVNMGKFILTFNYGNHNYGLSRDTIEAIARDGLASCVHMEIEGVRSLKYSYFEPRYILVVPMNKEKYEGYLRRKGLFSRLEIEFAVSRVDLYVKINQQFPGYFDAVINADDLDAAYQKLSRLIREYLGLSEETSKDLAPAAAGAPSSKKTPSGVPAHLVPSPRRLAKLQADGQLTEPHPGMQIRAQAPENQSAAPSQDQAPTQEGAAHQALSPSSRVSAEPPPQARDLSPDQRGGGVQQSDPSSQIVTTNLPENESRTSEVKARNIGQASITPSQGRPDQGRHPEPSAAHRAPPDQDEESGEAEGTLALPPPSEALQESGPTSLSPQRTQGEETESANLPPDGAHHEPPRDPSHPNGAKIPGPPLEDSRPPPVEGSPKAEFVRVSTPYPEVPHPQDSTDIEQTQGRDNPMTLLPRSRLAPTRLPQPRVLAPLQSRRPTPRLLSPSREEAFGTASHQTVTPSSRPPLAQEGDPSKLPPISPPHSKPPQSLSPHQDHSPQQVQEEKVREVKLPLISPPVQEHAPQPVPDPPEEEGTRAVRLPHIPTPFSEQQLPHDTGAHRDLRPAKERQAPKAGRSSSKKISDVRALPPNQEPVQRTGAREKNLPIQRETIKGPGHPEKVPPRSHQTALQPESQSKPTPPKVPRRPNPSPPQSPQGTQRRKVNAPEIPEPPHAEPLPTHPQFQEEKQGKVHHSREKARASLPPDDPVQEVAGSKKGPSLKRNSEGSSQGNKATLGGRQLHRGPLRSAMSSVGSRPDDSAPREHSGRREELHTRGRFQKRESPLDSPGQAATPQPVRETRAHRRPSQTRESSVRRDGASRRQAKEKHPEKPGGAPKDRSSAAAQNRVSAEEPGSRKGRLRARGSQSSKV